MGYYVRSIHDKKSVPNWKVQYVSTRLADRRETSKAKNPKRTWDIPKQRWSPLGFNDALSIEEARARAKQLNSQILLKRQEERLKKFNDEQITLKLKHQSVLPDEFVAEFEERFIRARNVFNEHIRQQQNRQRHGSWRAAQKVIIAVGIEPCNWFFHNEKFYDIFYLKQFSLGYLARVLSMINLWGRFICRKLGQPFLSVRLPRGYERQRLIEAYYQKSSPRRRPSEPITPEQLLKAKSILNELNFNWIYLSVWFGLRPHEIDLLHDENFWRVELLPTGRKILWVFQTKIVALPPEDRWKPIPILFDEQHFAIKVIEGKRFKRPLTKTIRKHFGNGHDCYGGRKGFVDLMLSKGHTIENISIWMGHSTLTRTWRSYKNKRRQHAL